MNKIGELVSQLCGEQDDGSDMDALAAQPLLDLLRDENDRRRPTLVQQLARLDRDLEEAARTAKEGNLYYAWSFRDRAVRHWREWLLAAFWADLRDLGEALGHINALVRGEGLPPRPPATDEDDMGEGAMAAGPAFRASRRPGEEPTAEAFGPPAAEEDDDE